jgi:hypothetical protein
VQTAQDRLRRTYSEESTTERTAIVTGGLSRSHILSSLDYECELCWIPTILLSALELVLKLTPSIHVLDAASTGDYEVVIVGVVFQLPT